MIALSNSTIATTILDQINAQDYWARARWGVRKLVSTDDSLELRIGFVKRVIVTYDESSDTYTVTCLRHRGIGAYDVVAEYGDVYADSLVHTIDEGIKKFPR